MSMDVFRVGRGGAGNWYSKKDQEEAEKRDVEAQANTAGTEAATSQPPVAPRPQQTPYTRGGRGGAGNFYDSAAVAAAERDEAVEAARVQATTTKSTVPASADSPALVTPSSARPRPGLSGRGGAGNWAASAAAAADLEEEQKRKEAAIAAQIQQDVEAGLAMPPKAYHQTPVTRDREK
ncbi:hypothetical protein SPBR_03198 [Sporothrix brasiliensis 5110]|uniref:Uncharacterized protein n=1 Tax=Sporothrix brasiliensis 5110 TaxID=1398154 RepID=A0A0C2FMD7_9PEZI|nr:uncharacterized protein SPBR_03198 [Sporothrix brasiliensis 5110]KIH92213.1 hypothetical protein SPBR_03198 [Sporothrix brasiliensis 5110]